MRLHRVRFTGERLAVALSSVVAGSLPGTSAVLAEADAVDFGPAYAAVVGLGAVMVARHLRRSSRPGPRSVLVSVPILAVLAWATIEWPVVRGRAFHARCENLYPHEPEAGEQDPVKRRGQLALHSGLRWEDQRAMIRPWATVPAR